MPGTNLVETQVYDPLFYATPLPFTGRYYPLGFPLEVAADTPDAIEAAAASWGRYEPRRGEPRFRVNVLSAPGSPALPPNPVFRGQGHVLAIVSDQENYGICDARQRFGCCWVSRATLADAVFFRWHFLDAMIYMLLEMTVTISFHAACVARNGAGILLFGDSGTGKSTLAYACARAGWTYIADDGSNLLLDARDRTIIGQPHCFRFREDAVSLFPELQGATAGRELDRKPTIELRTAGLEIPTAPECRAERIIFLDRRRSGPARLTRTGEETARDRLSRNLLVLEPEIQARRLDTLESLLEVPAYEMRYSSFEDALSLLDGLMRGQAR